MANISFDYDLTLDYAGEPNLTMIARFKEHMAFGDTIYIVTSRMEYDSDRQQIEEFLDEYGLLADGIFFTNFELKLGTLVSLKCSRHYDDNYEELIPLLDYGIEAIDAMSGLPI
jgi:hypothetical protein